MKKSKKVKKIGLFSLLFIYKYVKIYIIDYLIIQHNE